MCPIRSKPLHRIYIAYFIHNENNFFLLHFLSFFQSGEREKKNYLIVILKSVNIENACVPLCLQNSSETHTHNISSRIKLLRFKRFIFRNELCINLKFETKKKRIEKNDPHSDSIQYMLVNYGTQLIEYAILLVWVWLQNVNIFEFFSIVLNWRFFNLSQFKFK